MKYKKIISGIIASVMLFTNFAIAEKAEAAYSFGGGAGTVENPYKIITKAQLCNISLYPDAHYILMRSLEFTDADFAEGGICAGGWQSPDNFTGVFDGMGNSITNLKGTDGGFVNVNKGTIDSVVFKNHKLSGSDTFGAVADTNNGTITRCNVNLAITEDISPIAEESGGVAGLNKGEISYSEISGNLYITGPQYKYCWVYTGGFAGTNNGKIKNCYNDAYIYVYSPYVTEYVHIGGICGVGGAENCRNDGSMYVNANMDYVIYASPFGNDYGSSYYCYGSLDIRSNESDRISNYNSHNNMNCYKPYDFEEREKRLESSFPKFDFNNDWMITPDGPMPQGIMDVEGNCWSKNSYIAPNCVDNGVIIYENQYGETKTDSLLPIGHKPNAQGQGCLRDGCSENVITQLSLNITETSIYEEETVELYATFIPENATDQTLTWTSSDETVATVDENGLVTAINAGEAIITVSAVGGASAQCKITVEDDETAYPESAHPYESYADDWQEYIYYREGVKSLTIKFSEESELEAGCDYVYVYDAEGNMAKKYTGSQISGAVLSLNGSSFKIRLTSDGSGEYYGYKIDSITPSNEEVSYDVPIDEIYIEDYFWDGMRAEIGEIYPLNYWVYPENATAYVIWESSNEHVATIDSDGVITVVGYGDVTITARSSDGKFSTELNFEVKGPSYLNARSLTLNVGDTFDIDIVSKTKVNESYIYWRSDDESVVQVDDNGVVTAISEGETSVYNTYDYSEVYIRVTEGYSGLMVNSTYTIMAGKEYPLPVTGYDDEYIWGYVWYDGIADYDSSTRMIKGIREGECEINLDFGYLDVRVIEPYITCIYTVEDGVITDYEGDGETLVIPEEINGEEIVRIEYRAFESEYLKSVTIPGTVKSIGSYAFRWCENLESVTIEEGVETIGSGAFEGLDKLKYVELPTSLKYVYDEAFCDTNPDDVVYNGDFEDWLGLYISDDNNECLDFINQIHSQIRTADQLYQIADLVNNQTTNFENKRFNLMNSINLGGAEWTPIGIESNYGFKGIFNGNGYTISNFKITVPRIYNGFFGYLFDAEVTDLRVKGNIDVTNTEDVAWSWSGLLAGWLLHGTVTNCSANGSINVDGKCMYDVNIGGLIGRVSGNTTVVSDCSSNVSITCYESGTSVAQLGGLVGYFYATVADCTADASINYIGNGGAQIGGICGYQVYDSVSLTGCVARGNINAISSGDGTRIGGLMGLNGKLAENNKAYVDIVYSSENKVKADTAIADRYEYSWKEYNNVGYGNIYRAPYADFTFSEREDGGYTCDYTITAPELNGDAVFLSLYSGNKLLANIEVKENTASGTLSLTEKPDAYKIFVWDDLKKVTPVHSALCSKIQ